MRGDDWHITLVGSEAVGTDMPCVYAFEDVSMKEHVWTMGKNRTGPFL